MLKNFLTPQYLFDKVIPGTPFHLSDKLYFQFGVLLVVVGLAIWFFRRTLRNPVRSKLFGRWQHLTLIIGLLALFWAGLRYEAIRFFSMHVLVWLVYVIGLIWAITILKDWRTGYQKRLEDHTKEEIKQRYL